ncbi:MAG: hypothetical protein AABY87_11415 [bacterium]
MKRSAWFVMVLFLIPLFFSACEQKKTTTPPQPQTESQALPSANLPPNPAMPMHAGHESTAPQAPKTITVPEEVAGKWDSVVIRIEDKTKKTSVEQTIPMHTDYPIPGSSLIIKVGDFLPQFTMDQNAITSLSNETKNPALKVTILKEGNEVFNGWLFELYPDMHPFQDDRFAIALKGYNKKDAAK